MSLSKLDNSQVSALAVTPTSLITAVMDVLESNNPKVVLVAENNKLIGTITDGDVRRGLINGLNLNSIAAEFMNSDCIFTNEKVEEYEVLNLMISKQVTSVPIVDSKTNTLVGLYFTNSRLSEEKYSNPVVIMAGGLGQRMRPHTLQTPKPLLRVGDSTLLDRAIDKCIDAGFSNFYISVNYLKSQIMEHLGDGSSKGVNIVYLEEKSRLGTAGALSLISKIPDTPILVMNADVLHRVNLRNLLKFHINETAVATIGARLYETTVPFGVLKTESGLVYEIIEKPIETYLVSAGLYVLDSSVLFEIPKNQYLDMPELLNLILSKSGKVLPFPIHEDWLDVGNPESLDIAREEWK